MTPYQSENILGDLPEQRIQNWIQYSLFLSNVIQHTQIS